MSKLAKIGDAVRKRLIKSHSFRGKYHSSNRAQAEIQAAIAETSEGDLNKHVMRSCREAAKKMEDIFFLRWRCRQNYCNTQVLQRKIIPT